MSACALVGVGRLGGAARPPLGAAGSRRGHALASPGAVVLAVAHVAVFTLVVLALAGRVLMRVALAVLAPSGVLFFRILLRRRVRLLAHPGDGLADQLLDRRDVSGVGG